MSAFVVVSVCVVVLGIIGLRAWLRRELRCTVLPETIDWIFESFEWLLGNLGGYEKFSTVRFVTTTDFKTEGEEIGAQAFATIQQLVGVQHWPCRLVRGDDLPHDELSNKTTIGTFTADGRGGEGIVTYDETLEQRIEHLVPVLAHELSHYVMLAIDGEGPGGEEMEEPLTDLCATFLGFGILTTNASLEAVVDDAVGVLDLVRNPSLIRFSRLAYLDLSEFAYSLAVAATLLDRRDEISAALDLPARLQFHVATRHLDAHHLDRLAALRDVTGEDVRDAPHPLLQVREYLALADEMAELQDRLEGLRSRAPERSSRRKRKRKRERPPDHL